MTLPTAARPAHTPFVTIHANAILSGVPNLESDKEHGACEMVRFLLSRRHRRLRHFTGPSDLAGAIRRLRGYKKVLAGAKIPVDPELT